MTNAELNEAIAKALGWEMHPDMDGAFWHPPSEEEHISGDYCCWSRADLPWATSVDACLRDLLPAVRAKYPKAEWEFFQHIKHGAQSWAAVCHPYAAVNDGVRRDDPSLARAICLAFLAVIDAEVGR
ncbi:MAG: hypothetical protein HY873_13260 [Chloroflexi bacterium]|nr:hypothetical protein [Chloroflexota bacterium]